MNIIETDWKWNGTLSDRAETDYIALHHAAAVVCTAAQVHQWHKENGWSGIGYHFFVRKNGEIYRGRPIDKTGAHVSGMNNCAIGVCAEGDYDREHTMPAVQKCAIKELLKHLKSIYPEAEIVGHGEIGASDCPGKYYPLAEMKNTEVVDMEELIKLRAELDALKNPMIYNYIDENMPEWAREGVQWCVDNGIITGNGEGLGLDDRDLRYCAMLMRLGRNNSEFRIKLKGCPTGTAF